MKILHCCLAAFYIDNYEYQENILPRMHKLQGHDVMILASTETYVDKIKLGYVSPGQYLNEDGILVKRIPYCQWLPHKIASKLRYYNGITSCLNEFKPDIIFLHDAQFMSISSIIKYVNKNKNVKIYVDGHSDFGNSARTFISKYILHSIFYKHCIHKIEPYTTCFWGTLPARVKFFTDFYGTPHNKTKLLVMGADDKLVNKAKEMNQREVLRNRFNIGFDTFLVVSGGKFDKGKQNIFNVMRAVKKMSNTINIKMLIFGSVSKENGFDIQFNSLCDGSIIQYVGWIKGSEAYNYFEASDVVIFPATHSVLWEQAVGQGKPCIFRYIEDMTHVDLGGNCLFLKEVTEDEIMDKISECIDNYTTMANVAKEKGLKYFSYNEIAHRALI